MHTVYNMLTLHEYVTVNKTAKLVGRIRSLLLPQNKHTVSMAVDTVSALCLINRLLC